MIKGTMVKVADNSGGIEAEIFHVYGGFKRLSCRIGDIVMVAIKRAIPNSKVKSGNKSKAVIIRTKNPLRRTDGSISWGGDNAVVLLDAGYNPIGTSVSGFLAREIATHVRPEIRKIASMSKEVY